MAVIDLENLEVSYGGFRALNGVSLQIEGGAIGLLGPNGAGKSTLIKTLLGYIRPSKGRATVLGHELPAHALEVRQQLGYMPEREVTSAQISAVSFITYCGRLFGMSRIDALERTHEVLNYVGLGESRYRKMETYSTGMLQRVKLAQALIHDPKLLLLDEPTNGLDPDGHVEVLDLIREVASHRGVTVILSSHLLQDVHHVCDRIIMISGGRVVRDGTIAALTAGDENRYEVTLRDKQEQYLLKLREAGLQGSYTPAGRILVEGPGLNGGRTLFEIARACDTQIRHFQVARHSLTEVFMQAVAQGGEETGKDA